MDSKIVSLKMKPRKDPRSVSSTSLAEALGNGGFGLENHKPLSVDFSNYTLSQVFYTRFAFSFHCLSFFFSEENKIYQVLVHILRFLRDFFFKMVLEEKNVRVEEVFVWNLKRDQAVKSMPRKY